MKSKHIVQMLDKHPAWSDAWMQAVEDAFVQDAKDCVAVLKARNTKCSVSVLREWRSMYSKWSHLLSKYDTPNSNLPKADEVTLGLISVVLKLEKDSEAHTEFKRLVTNPAAPLPSRFVTPVFLRGHHGLTFSPTGPETSRGS